MKLTKQGVPNLDAIYGYAKKKTVAVPPQMEMEYDCHFCQDKSCVRCAPELYPNLIISRR